MRTFTRRFLWQTDEQGGSHTFEKMEEAVSLEAETRTVPGARSVRTPARSGGSDMASYDIGEKPGVGRYCCETCSNWSVKLDDADDKLPPCGKCGPGQNTTYTDC